MSEFDPKKKGRGIFESNSSDFTFPSWGVAPIDHATFGVVIFQLLQTGPFLHKSVSFMFVFFGVWKFVLIAYRITTIYKELLNWTIVQMKK